MDFLTEYTLPVVMGICLCVGYVIKIWIGDVDNKYIPTIVAVLGVALSVWVNGWQITPQAILCGLISGLSSTGAHQAFKQFLNKDIE